jgi:hypothetical protein
MRRAHARCPDSNATRGNVDVTLRVDGTGLGLSVTVGLPKRARDR